MPSSTADRHHDVSRDRDPTTIFLILHFFLILSPFEICDHTDSTEQQSHTFTRLDVCQWCSVSANHSLLSLHVPLVQRFSIPRSAHLIRFSYRFRHLYYSTVSALRSGHHITGYSAMVPVRRERICSIQRALKCARRELYLFTEVYYVTLSASLESFICVWRRCAAQIHEWMFPSKYTSPDFPCSGSREQWTLCRDHAMTWGGMISV